MRLFALMVREGAILKINSTQGRHDTDGECGNDGDLDHHGDDDCNFEGDDDTSDDDGESKGVDSDVNSDDSDADDGGVGDVVPVTC